MSSTLESKDIKYIQRSSLPKDFRPERRHQVVFNELFLRERKLFHIQKQCICWLSLCALWVVFPVTVISSHWFIHTLSLVPFLLRHGHIDYCQGNRQTALRLKQWMRVFHAIITVIVVKYWMTRNKCIKYIFYK